MIKNKLIYSLMLCAVISITSACAIPMGGHYYSPTSSYGTVVSEYCRSSVGPRNSVDMKFGKLELILSAGRKEETATNLNLQVYGDASSLRSFNPDDISIYDNDKQNVLEKKSIRRWLSNSRPNYYAYGFTIDAAPTSFTVKLPDIVVDGQSYKDLVVTFTYQFGTWYEVPNC